MAKGLRVVGRVSGRMAAVVLLSYSLTSIAHAETAPEPATRTILLIGPLDDPASKRTIAELRALGFEVKTIRDTPAAGTDSEIERVSRSADAIATIGIDRGSGEVHVWTIDRASGRVVLRAIVAMEQDPAVVALRAVEALRTSLNGVEHLVPPRAAATGEPTPREVDRPPRTGEPRGPPSVGVSIGPALSASAGNFAVSWQGLVLLHWLLGPSLGIAAMAVAPITDARWTEAEGSASLTFGLVGAGVHWQPVARRWWVLDFGAGLGAVLIHTEGFPNAGFVGQKHNTLVASPFARMGCAIWVTSSLWIRADVASAVAIPRPVLAFAERAAGPWGEPLVVGSVGIEIALH